MTLLRELIDYDPLTKTKTIFHDQGDDKYIIETQADVTDLLELNKAQYNDVDERTRWGEKSWTAARLPLHVYFDLVRRGIANDKVAFAKWLDDPENSGWRTRPGKLSR